MSFNAVCMHTEKCVQGSLCVRSRCSSSFLLWMGPHLGVARVQGLIDGAKLSFQRLHIMCQVLSVKHRAFHRLQQILNFLTIASETGTSSRRRSSLISDHHALCQPNQEPIFIPHSSFNFIHERIRSGKVMPVLYQCAETRADGATCCWAGC